MKTREIEVWVVKKELQGLKLGRCGVSIWPQNASLGGDRNQYIKATLILPAEPEVLEFETDDSGNRPPGVIDTMYGRRWKVVATEIIENESLNLK